MTDLNISEGPSADGPSPVVPTCRNGHPRTPENTYVYPSGKQECRACRKQAHARTKAKRAAGLIEYKPRRTDADGVARCASGQHRMEGENVYGWRQCRACALAGQAARYAAVKLAVLTAYSANGDIVCSCPGCDERDIRVLGLDHSWNDGADHRRELGGGGGHRFYRHLRREGFPQDLGLVVACRNCDSGRAVAGGVCPDVAPQPEPLTEGQRKRRKLKRDVIALLGGACERCGLAEPLAFLTLEHRDGGGVQHRETLGNGDQGRGGQRLYQALRAGDEPPDAYGVLCWNCQCIAEYERREEQER